MEKRSHKALLGKKTFECLLTTDFYVMRDLMTFFYAQLLFRFLCGDIWTLLKLFCDQKFLGPFYSFNSAIALVRVPFF